MDDIIDTTKSDEYESIDTTESDEKVSIDTTESDEYVSIDTTESNEKVSIDTTESDEKVSIDTTEPDDGRETRGRKRPAETTNENQDSASKPPEAKLRSNLPSTTLAISTERKLYTLVNEESQIKPALEELLRQDQDTDGPSLAVDCEGERLSRRGKLSLVSVGTEDHVYLFDIQTLGARVFDQGLRELLEDADREKLMFDCRQDSDCLWHLFQVKLANVLDLQLLQIIYRQEHPETSAYMSPPRGFQPMLRGFSKCLGLYVNNYDFVRAKDAGYALLNRDKEIFMKRPLEVELLEYATVDIRGSFPLYQKLKGPLDSSIVKANLKRGSQKYLDMFRFKDDRDYSDYELNAFLPWGVLDLPKYKHTTSYREEITCTACKRRFSRSHFQGNELRGGLQKCLICKKIDERRNY